MREEKKYKLNGYALGLIDEVREERLMTLDELGRAIGVYENGGMLKYLCRNGRKPIVPGLGRKIYEILDRDSRLRRFANFGSEEDNEWFALVCPVSDLKVSLKLTN